MSGSPKFIKVGQTRLPLEKRRRDLNTGNPFRLDIVAAWRVTDKGLGEKAAHLYLDSDRKSYERTRPKYGGGREWFLVKKGGCRKVYDGIEKNLRAKNLFVKRVY